MQVMTALRERVSALRTDIADLVLARACLDCEAVGRVMCAPCLQSLRGAIIDTREVDGIPATAAVDYAEHGQRLVLAYKEGGLRSLAPMLGTLLADAVQAHAGRPGSDRVHLVPVPAHRLPERGFDALSAIVRCAARDLTDRGLLVRVERAIGSARYRPLKSLGRRERQVEMVDAFRLRRGWRPHAIDPAGVTLVVDDVITTGATTSAMTSTLARAGVRVDGIAAVTMVSPDRSGPSRGPARPRPRR